MDGRIRAVSLAIDDGAWTAHNRVIVTACRLSDVNSARMRAVAWTVAILLLIGSGRVFAQIAPLTDEQIAEAIALGKKGDVPVALAGRFLGISKGDFDVFIEGPEGRIADAAEHAFRQMRQFTEADVTPEMKEPLYLVFIQPTRDAARRPTPTHIVLMPRHVTDVASAIQPVREPHEDAVWQAAFDRLPPGDFDVVVATSDGIERYNVDGKARQKIR